MIEEFQETLQTIENLNRLLRRNLITFSEFFKLKIELYEKAYKINEILELEYNIKTALTPFAKEIFEMKLDFKKEFLEMR